MMDCGAPALAWTNSDYGLKNLQHQTSPANSLITVQPIAVVNKISPGRGVAGPLWRRDRWALCVNDILPVGTSMVPGRWEAVHPFSRLTISP